MLHRPREKNSDYRLFLKHWRRDIIPSSYRGDIIFVDDSQGANNINVLANNFAEWADYYSPNPVMFQIGYQWDKSWWKSYENPPLVIGRTVAEWISNKNQELGIFWVDFTLRDKKVKPFFFNN